jgi:hypothetical protein
MLTPPIVTRRPPFVNDGVTAKTRVRKRVFLSTRILFVDKLRLTLTTNNGRRTYDAHLISFEFYLILHFCGYFSVSSEFYVVFSECQKKQLKKATYVPTLQKVDWSNTETDQSAPRQQLESLAVFQE